MMSRSCYKLSAPSRPKLVSNLISDDLGHPASFYVDHAENCDKLEEDSVDRLWLVVRSLKNQLGKYVSILMPLILQR